MATAPNAGGTYSRETLSQEAPTADGLISEGREGRDRDTATLLPPMAEEQAVGTFGSPGLSHGWRSLPGSLSGRGYVHRLPLATLGPKPAGQEPGRAALGPDPHTGGILHGRLNPGHVAKLPGNPGWVRAHVRFK